MKVCAWFLLFTIFAFTDSTSQENQPDNPKNVNLELETLVDFNKKDKRANIKFLDDVHDFISKVKTAIVNNKKLRRDTKGNKLEIKNNDNKNNVDKPHRGHKRNKKAKHTKSDIKHQDRETPQTAKYDDERVMQNRRNFKEFNSKDVVTDTIKFSLEYQPWYPEEIDNKQTTKAEKKAKKERQSRDLDNHENTKSHHKSHKAKRQLKLRAENDNKEENKHIREKHLLKRNKKHVKHRSMSKHRKAKLYKKQKHLPTIELFEYKKQFRSVTTDLIPDAPTITTKASTSSLYTPNPFKRHVRLRPNPLILPRFQPLLATPTEENPSSTASKLSWLDTAAHDESNELSKTNKKKDSIQHILSGKGQKLREKEMRRDTKSSKAKPEKVISVLRRINELEKELTDVKNKLSDIKVSELKRTVLYWQNGEKSERKTSIRTDEFNDKGKKRRGIEDIKFVYKHVKDNNSSNIKDEVDTNNKALSNNKNSKTKEDDKTIATQTNFIFRVSSGTKVTKGIKFMIEDQDYVNAKDPRIKNDYDGVDEWKALKFARIEPVTPSTTAKSTTLSATVKSSTITTIEPSPAPVSSSSKSAAAQRASETTLEDKTNKHDATSLLSDVSQSSPPTTEVVREISNSNMSTENIVDVNSSKLENVTVEIKS